MNKLSKLLVATALAATLYVPTSAHAAGQKTALIVWGWFGKSFMQPVADAVAKRGYKVTFVSWLTSPVGEYTVAIGHSNGDIPALLSGTTKVITIDPTFLALFIPRRYGTLATNYFAWQDAIPFIVCCGGYPVPGATNVVAPPGHIQMPKRVLPLILKELP